MKVMQMILASEAGDIVLLPGEASISVCLFWSTSSFIRLNAHRSFSPPFPCSRTFHNMLVVSASRRSFFFCFVSECACSEVVHLLISNPIPCLLSMHSERVFVFCFLRVKIQLGSSPGSVFFLSFFISTAQKCLVTNTQMFLFFFFFKNTSPCIILPLKIWSVRRRRGCVC